MCTCVMPLQHWQSQQIIFQSNELNKAILFDVSNKKMSLQLWLGINFLIDWYVFLPHALYVHFIFWNIAI